MRKIKVYYGKQGSGKTLALLSEVQRHHGYSHSETALSCLLSAASLPEDQERLFDLLLNEAKSRKALFIDCVIFTAAIIEAVQALAELGYPVTLASQFAPQELLKTGFYEFIYCDYPVSDKLYRMEFTLVGKNTMPAYSAPQGVRG
jgi:hypothetical protein